MSGVVDVWCGQCPILQTLWSLSNVANVCVVNVVQSGKGVTPTLAWLLAFVRTLTHFFPSLNGKITSNMKSYAVRHLGKSLTL